MIADLDTLATRMLEDLDRRQPGSVFAEGRRLSLDEAYELQGAVARRREARGERVVGYKIGCTAPVNQRRHGLDQPVRGRLWSTEQHEDGATLREGDFANLALEAEVAVTLGRDLTGEVTADDVLASVDEVLVVLELHHLVLRGGAPTGPELVAHNAIHAGVVRGAGHPPPAPGSTIDLALEMAGTVVDRWTDHRWPDDVLGAVPWLVGELAQEGRALSAGDLVLTGAWGPPRPANDWTRDIVVGPSYGLAARSRALGTVAAQCEHVPATVATSRLGRPS